MLGAKTGYPPVEGEARSFCFILYQNQKNKQTKNSKDLNIKPETLKLLKENTKLQRKGNQTNIHKSLAENKISRCTTNLPLPLPGGGMENQDPPLPLQSEHSCLYWNQEAGANGSLILHLQGHTTSAHLLPTSTTLQS